jgi:WD40 repeat protein
VALTPDAASLAALFGDGRVRLMDVATAEEVATLAFPAPPSSALALSPDGSRIAFHEIRRLLLGGRDGRLLRDVSRPLTRTRHVAFSPDGRRIATAANEMSIEVVDAETGASRIALKGHRAAPTCTAFSPDGRRIASGLDHTVRVWDALDGSLLLTLEGFAEPVTVVVFSPDGHGLAAGARDGSVRVWSSSPSGTAASDAEDTTDDSDDQ